MVKVNALLSEAALSGDKSLSFEFFPPTKTRAEKDGVDTLFYRIAEMGKRLRPSFVSLTWRSSFKDESVWLKIGSMVQQQLGVQVLLHLTCHLPRKELVKVLSRAREAGIRNILALRGDSAHFAAGSSGSKNASNFVASSGGFKHAVELVHFIRAEHGDHFCIGVGAYPEVHTSSWNSEFLPPSDQARDLDLQRLKDKVDAGADFIITQFCYDTDVFLEFLRRCREIGISAPILAGYAPIQNYASFQKLCKWVKASVPKEVEERLARIQGNDEQVHEYGIELGVKQVRALLKSDIAGVHFFTLNLAGSVAAILSKLGLRDDQGVGAQQRELPFRGVIRAQEEIRPIFWSNRYSSYLSRTSTWKEFPNGRWGDSQSAASFELSDYYLAEKQRSNVDLVEMWGYPQTTEDVIAVFTRYIRGEIEQLPWCEQSLALETESIFESLFWINSNGFLTINSQPKINGVSSSDDTCGWGGPGGICFQKAYVEFFCSPEMWFKLKAVMDAQDEFRGRLSYHAINNRGEEFINDTQEASASASGDDADAAANKETIRSRPSALSLRKDSFVDELGEEKREESVRRVNAVTWGVFPGREIIQPTVVDTTSFRVWKDEAFELWLSAWASIYKDDEGTTAEKEKEPVSMNDNGKALRAGSIKVLKEIHDKWFLVNIVDNDYVSESSNIFDVFKSVILDGLTPGQLRERIDTLESINAKQHRELIRLRSLLNNDKNNNNNNK